MNWYQAQDSSKSVRQVVIEVPEPKAVSPKFGMMMLGSKYHILRTNVWCAGYFRMDSDTGPYMLLRADGYASKLQGQQLRVAHCFYRMKNAGLYAIFIDFPKLKLSHIPSGPFVLFEMIRGIDMEDERSRISDGINRPDLHICFAEGDGPGEESGGVWQGGPINALFDVLVEFGNDARQALNQEWDSLLDYHRSLPSGKRHFQAGFQQMQTENPLSRNPIIDRNSQKVLGNGSADQSGYPTPSKRWWHLWK